VGDDQLESIPYSTISNDLEACISILTYLNDNKDNLIIFLSEN
jgi:hypothetical protein